MVKKIVIYTDGACSGNPGPGGWSAVLMYGEHIKELSGGEKDTTNNRMEMLGVIKGLENLKERCEVHIYTDSAYIYNCFQQKWYVNWQKNGWKNSQKKPVENKDLWETMLELVEQHDVHWHKVKGHSGDKWNERADVLAVEACKKYR
ncbi:ribonuclease HI [Desulfuribacillus stibiiarsenatis]|uniref:Ribonuclease H n=1 Tax=Desulfuribacillus stibiiarsenatis TaxID=1390249 RepID=A0A1E5L8Z7_9FIRM|nr:ribonuclease HI [Desulfuribacillus stibiiarsenatis]OEH86620.1 ribonuclease HI [Desulfuribacillus stibiiarsenatis]